MAEEAQGAAAVIDPPAQTDSPAGSPAAETPSLPEIDRATLLQLLDQHGDDPEFRKELRGRRAIAGIAGDIAQRTLAEREEAAAKTAVEGERKRLRDLADSDPLAFAEEVKVKIDLEEQRRQTAGLRDLTRREFAGKVGAALRDLPEFSELTAADVEALTKSLAGVPEDDLIAVFTKKATDIVAEKRSDKRYKADIDKRLADERKVWEREQADKQRQARRAPSVRPPSQGNAADTGEPRDHLSAEWTAWDNTQRKNGLGIYAMARR